MSTEAPANILSGLDSIDILLGGAALLSLVYLIGERNGLNKKGNNVGLAAFLTLPGAILLLLGKHLL